MSSDAAGGLTLIPVTGFCYADSGLSKFLLWTTIPTCHLNLLAWEKTIANLCCAWLPVKYAAVFLVKK